MLQRIKRILVISTLVLGLSLILLGEVKEGFTTFVMGAIMFGDFILIEIFSYAIVEGRMKPFLLQVIFLLKLPLILVIIIPLYRLGLIDPLYLFVGVGLLPLSIILGLIGKGAGVKDG